MEEGPRSPPSSDLFTGSSAVRRRGKSARVAGWTDAPASGQEPRVRRSVSTADCGLPADARRAHQRRPRAGLRGVPGDAGPSDSGSGVPPLLGRDPAAHAPALRLLRRSVAHVARDQPSARQVSALPARAAAGRSHACDRRVRRRAAGRRPGAQIRRAAIAGTAARHADASARRRHPRRRALRDPGAAPSLAPAPPRLQPGCRSRAVRPRKRACQPRAATATCGTPSPPTARRDRCLGRSWC